MSRLVVRSYGVSLDGFGAGADQSLDNPLGLRGMELMQWRFPTRAWHQFVKKEGGETGRDGLHTEAFSRLLAEMQVVARAHPMGSW